MKKKFNLFDIVLYIGMFLVIIITLLPFWNQVVTSVSTTQEINQSGFILFPKSITFSSYKLAFDYSLLWTGYYNSIIRTILGVSIAVSVTVLFAYPLSKEDLPLNGLFSKLLIFTMIFDGGIIARFLLIKNLNMLNTMSALIFPMVINPFNVIVARSFFSQIPRSFEESAKIDGAGYTTIFFRIILPLSKPVIATISLWVFVAYWNNWFDSLMYIDIPDKQVLQVVLRNIIVENDMDAIKESSRMQRGQAAFSGIQLQATMIILGIIPMLVIYPFIQKYFVKGIFIGGVKG